MRPDFRRFAAYLAGLARPVGGTRTLAIVVALVATAALASASPAVAQNDPTSAQYCEEGVLNEVTGECEEAAAGTFAQPSGAEAGGGGVSDRVVGSLPFTGIDLIALGVVALALLGTGFVLRRLSAPRDL